MNNFLDTTFASFDYTILHAIHKFAKFTDEGLNGFFKYFSFLAEKGIILILIAIILMLFKKTRKIGICMFGAIGLGAIITNLWLKDVVARIRPYNANHSFFQWWIYAGNVIEKDFSFPSGHTTAAMASMMAIFLNTNKKYSWTAFIFTFMIAFSRLYLVVHYPTDIIAGLIIGALAGIVAHFITIGIYLLFDKFNNNKVCEFIQEFDIRDIIFKFKK